MLNLLNDAFLKILKDESCLLDEDFMINVFKEFRTRLTRLKEYVAYMFEQKHSAPVDEFVDKEDKVFPFDLLRATLVYQTCQGICKTSDLCASLAEEAALVFHVEFRDKLK